MEKGARAATPSTAAHFDTKTTDRADVGHGLDLPAAQLEQKAGRG